MANSKYESSRLFEPTDTLLPSVWIVIRIDGRGFHRFSARHNFTKPNDKDALDLMNTAAKGVLAALPDICIAYGVSDEYSFVFHKETSLFSRRQSKLRWRQVDCHINNLYNTCFWALVKGGMTKREAEKELQGTTSANKNEILFSRFGINYNNEMEIFKKGSIIFRESHLPAVETQVKPSKTQLKKQEKGRRKATIVVGHHDIIKDVFWDERPWILMKRFVDKAM